MKKVAAGAFKDQCLALMDQVQRTGESVLITKHGKPVAKLIPAKRSEGELFDSMSGRATAVGDIVHGTASAEDWENS